MKSNDGRTQSVAIPLTTVVETPASESTLASAKEAPHGEWTGESAGRYRLRRELGVGGMGRVYEGYDPELQRRVAVKLLHSSFDAEWLSREARALAKLSHPNVVAVYDVGTFRGRVFVAMELIEGPTLRRWVAEHQRSLEEVLAMAMQAGQGLAAAHAAGLLHRDFKPDNVMVGHDGRVRVLDFGIVRAFKPLAPGAAAAAPKTAPATTQDWDVSGVDAADSLAGTPAYMAPEQLWGEQVSFAADQFSFCVSLWEMLYGQRPYEPDKLLEVGLGLKRGQQEPQAPKDADWVPSWLRRVLERGLAIDAAERHASMSALLEALEAGLAHAAAERRWLGRRYEILSAASGTTLPGAEPALDRFTGRLVTIKRVPSSPGSAAGVTRAELAEAFGRCASLRHPNLIGVLDFGLDSSGAAYWVLDLKDEGTSLAAALGRAGTSVALDYGAQLVQLLRYLHKREVRLGAVDPALLLVVGDQVKLAPIWQPRAQRSTRSEPPIAKASDQLSAIDDELRAVLERLLASDPAARYQTTDELLHALEAVTGQTPATITLEQRESVLRAGPFLGREEEILTLTNAVRAACNRQGSAWLVSGESGVGKSRLLEETATLAVVQGALVLRGHEESEAGGPYRLFREALRGLALLSELDEVEASVLAPVVPNLGRILGRAVPSAPELDALSTHGRLVEVVKKLLLRQSQPIVMLLEDVQWARSDSLDLLQHLAKAATGSAVLLVATAREDVSTRFREQVPALSSLRLGRLPRPALARLAEAMIGESAKQPGLLELLQRETEGNAFFFVEVVRALAEGAGGLERIGVTKLPDKVFAGGVQNVVQQRLRGVSGQARALLTVAAVAGRWLEPKVLARLMPDADLSDCIARCVDAAILERNGEQLRFGHDKLREGVLATLSDEQRAELEGRVAEALEAEHAGDPEFYAAIAHHYRQASNLAKEAHFAGLAGDYALMHGALREAIELLERARTWLARGTDGLALARVCVTLGDAYYLMNDTPKAMSSSAQAGAALGVSFPTSAVGRGFALVWELGRHVAYRLWPTLAVERDPARREANQVASFAAGCAVTVHISQSNALGVLLFSLMAWNLGERGGSRNLWASGVLGYGLATLGFASAAKSYFPSTERGARVVDGSYAIIKTGYLLGLGELGAAEALMQEGLELAPRTGFYRAEAFRWFYLGYCAYFRGEVAEADKRFTLAAESEGTRASFAPGLSLVRCLGGRLNEAESLLTEALQDGNPAAPRATAFGVLALIQTRRSELPAALRSADQAVALAAGGNTFGYAGAPYFAGVFEAYLAELEQAQTSGRSTGLALRGLRKIMRHCRAWAKAFPIGRPLLLYYQGRLAKLTTDERRAQRLWREAEALAGSMHIGPYAALAAPADVAARRADAKSAT